MSERIVQIDNIKYYTILEESDDGSTAPCILLCHALMSNLGMYDHTVDVLHAAGFATLRFDHIGHGNTAPPESTDAAWTMDDLTRHMHHIVREASGDTHVAGVVGCSIGGVLALRYAMLFPQDVDATVSITAPGVTTSPAFAELWSDRVKQFERDDRAGQDSLCRATVERWFPGGRPEDDAARADALKLVKTCSFRGYQTLANAISHFDYTGDIDKLSGVRCLVVAGREDKASSADALRDLSASIGGAGYVCIDHAGHLPLLQKPAEFHEAVLAFLHGRAPHPWPSNGSSS